MKVDLQRERYAFEKEKDDFNKLKVKSIDIDSYFKSNEEDSIVSEL